MQDKAVPLAADFGLRQQHAEAQHHQHNNHQQHRPVGTDKVADVKQQLGQEGQSLHLVEHRLELGQDKGHKNRNDRHNQHAQDDGVHQAVADLLVHLVLTLIVGGHAGAGVVDAAGALGAANHRQQQVRESGRAGLHRVRQRHALAQLAQDGLIQGFLAGVNGALVCHNAEGAHQRHTGGQQRAEVAAEIRQQGGFQRAEGGVALLGLLRGGHIQAVLAQFGVQGLLGGGIGQPVDGLAFCIGRSIAETWHRGETSEKSRITAMPQQRCLSRKAGIVWLLPYKNRKYQSRIGCPASMATTMPAQRNGPKAKWSFLSAFLAASR